MKESEVRVNCMVWSKRLKKYGQAIAQARHMVFVIFVGHEPLWLHCSEICFDARDDNGE